jgi:hypothetical protein
MLNYNKMPVMSPIPIKTKNLNYLGALWVWLVTTRKWKIEADWKFTLDSTEYKIPEGFVFDGASVPKYFRSWLSPMGVLLIAGLVHDYGYKNQALMMQDNVHAPKKTQKEFDITFRDIAIEVNGFKIINYIAYYALRLGGWWAWKGHRKNDKI